MGVPMGIGQLGFKNTVFKRKFRFLFGLDNICGNPNHSIPPSIVKLAARPNLSIEETEINHLHAKKWIPGKAAWEAITVTYYDVGVKEIKPIYNWLASVYNFMDPVSMTMASSASDYSARGILSLYDGCGESMETWFLDEVWPTSVNFGELDYADSEVCTIEMTLRYSHVFYVPQCPAYEIDPCCFPCGRENNGLRENDTPNTNLGGIFGGRTF